MLDSRSVDLRAASRTRRNPGGNARGHRRLRADFFLCPWFGRVEGSPVHLPSLTSTQWQRASHLCGNVIAARLAHRCYRGRGVARQCDYAVGTFAIRALFVSIQAGNEWSFYAPDVRVEPEFRYVVEDASGERHTFVPADKLSRYHPTDIWVKDWYIHVMDNPETYSEFVAAYLCREHASLHPVSITLLEIDQKEFSPAGPTERKTPLRSEFLDKKTLATVQCPNQ